MLVRLLLPLGHEELLLIVEQVEMVQGNELPVLYDVVVTPPSGLDTWVNRHSGSS
jgi:hypothetical protein